MHVTRVICEETHEEKGEERGRKRGGERERKRRINRERKIRGGRKRKKERRVWEGRVKRGFGNRGERERRGGLRGFQQRSRPGTLQRRH